MKILSWNIARREAAWRYLLETDCDIALLQEATAPPADVAGQIDAGPAPWHTAGAGVNRPWRTAIVQLSDRVDVQWFEPKSVGDARPGELAVSRLGTVAAAMITPSSGAPFIVASIYAPWEKPHATTGSAWIYADASVHRLISDLSVFIGREVGHRIIAAAKRPARLRREWQCLLGRMLRHHLLPDVRIRIVVRRSTGPGWTARGPVAP